MALQTPSPLPDKGTAVHGLVIPASSVSPRDLVTAITSVTASLASRHISRCVSHPQPTRGMLECVTSAVNDVLTSTVKEGRFRLAPVPGDRQTPPRALFHFCPTFPTPCPRTTHHTLPPQPPTPSVTPSITEASKQRKTPTPKVTSCATHHQRSTIDASLRPRLPSTPASPSSQRTHGSQSRHTRITLDPNETGNISNSASQYGPGHLSSQQTNDSGTRSGPKLGHCSNPKTRKYHGKASSRTPHHPAGPSKRFGSSVGGTSA